MTVSTLILVSFVAAGGAGRQAVPAMQVVTPDRPEVVTSALAEAIGLSVVVTQISPPRGKNTSARVRTAWQPPYGQSLPPNRNVRGLVILAGAVAGMVAGAYAGWAVDSQWGTRNAVKGMHTGAFAGGVLGGLAVWRLTR